MSDHDFILVEEEDRENTREEGEKASDRGDKKNVVPADGKKEKDREDDGYEKICFICHRPESVTGKMIDLPNNITVCPDCMQRSFDAMTNGSVDLNRLMNMPGVQFFNMSDLENMQPRQQKIKKKSRKSSISSISKRYRRLIRSRPAWMSM